MFVLIKFIVYLTVVYCNAISIDYFNADKDKAEPTVQYANETLSLSFKDESHTVLQTNITGNVENVTLDHNESKLTEGFKSIEVYVENDEPVINDALTKQIGRSRGNFSITTLELNKSDIVVDSSDVINIHSDYEYVYDDDNSTIRQHLLRQESIKSQTGSNNSDLVKSNADHENCTTDDESNSTKPVADFYNLQPAATISNHEDSFGIVKFANNNVWYVPERYPCWELPILYGELGQKKSTTDVFLLYSRNLKNVIDSEDDVITQSRPVMIPVAQTLNKWCAVAPCYGDHTLCLFTGKCNSNLCSENYKVLTPSTVEQIGLVNTVNSMRNRVANGDTDIYHHLPTAANMKQIIYDFDLERMAEAWLLQCLPGPAPCSALEGNYVAQLECTKYADHCCINSYKNDKASKCIPKYECFVDPIIGCIHAWYCSAGRQLTTTDVQCGHLTATTFNTAQLFWADTNKIGCAYAKKSNGDVRVVCNFAPGAPFYIDTKYYCGFIAHKYIMSSSNKGVNITNAKYLTSLGINMHPMKSPDYTDANFTSHHVNYSTRFLDIDVLSKIYKQRWVREKLGHYSNGSIALLARLVTRYSFTEDSGSRCDFNEPVYITGTPGSQCVERGRRFHALCYDFRDPTPGYRLVAVLAPVALFTLILYDLFSGVVRQTNY